MSDMLNDYFLSVYEQYPRSIELCEELQAVEFFFLCKLITRNTQQATYLQSYTPDDQHPKIYKGLSKLVNSPLNEIFNRSMRIRIIPDDGRV